MASRVVRNTAILLKAETTYGTDAAPSAATDAILPTNEGLTLTPVAATMVDRDVVRPYLGASEQLPSEEWVDMAFNCEMVGAGAGISPAWSAALRLAGFAETVTATTRVDLVPITENMEAGSAYWNDSGVLHKALGARNAAGIRFTKGGVPLLLNKLRGLIVDPTAVTVPNPTFTAWKKPQVVNKANSLMLTMGATHTPTGAPALVGGTQYPSLGLEIDFGIENPFTGLIGAETVDITNRRVTGKVTFDLTAAQEIAFTQAVRQVTLSSLGFVHGTVAGQKTMVFAPAVQMTNPQKVNQNGKRLVSFDLIFTPVNGNDEIRIVTSF